MEENTETESSNEQNNEDINAGSSEKSTAEDDSKTNDEVKNRLEAKLSDAYGKQDDLQNKYLRVHADLENLKKRSIKEREDAVHRTRSQLISDLLPSIDAFKMGLSEAEKHTNAREFVEGFGMAMKQMNNVLDEYGLVVLEPTEQEFEGTVIKTIRCGYRLGDKLLRPASVILSKKETAEK